MIIYSYKLIIITYINLTIKKMINYLESEEGISISISISISSINEDDGMMVFEV